MTRSWSSVGYQTSQPRIGVHSWTTWSFCVCRPPSLFAWTCHISTRQAWKTLENPTSVWWFSMIFLPHVAVGIQQFRFCRRYLWWGPRDPRDPRDPKALDVSPCCHWAAIILPLYIHQRVSIPFWCDTFWLPQCITTSLTRKIITHIVIYDDIWIFLGGLWWVFKLLASLE